MRPIVLMSCGLTDDRGSFSSPLTYVKAVEAGGGTVLVIPPGQQDEAALADACALADAILLPGGWDVDPGRFGEESIPANGRVEPDIDAVDFSLARHALQTGKPVLGICRGCQVLNVVAGGSLYQDLGSQWGKPGLLQHRQQAPRWHASHQIKVSPDSLLADILGETNLRVNSFHHQAVHHPAPGTQVTAYAADGVVEAFEVSGHPFAIGVQWHPEGMLERHPVQLRLFTAFVQAGQHFHSHKQAG